VKGQTALVDATLSGEALSPPSFATDGLIEKTAVRWFTARQSIVAAFIWFPGVRWSRAWTKSAIAFALLSAATFIFRSQPLELPAYGAGFLLGCCFLPIIRNARGLDPWLIAPGLVSSTYAGFPISYNELLAVVAKPNFIQFVAALPLWIAYGALVSGIFADSVFRGAVIAAQAWLIALLIQPFVILRWFSDGAAMTPKGGGLILVVVLISLFFVMPLLSATLAINRFPLFWGIALTLALISFGALLLHRHLYRRRGLDCASGAQ
jgi:hypothetical protein